MQQPPSEIPGRQFDALLARLDRIAGELERLNRRLDRGDELQRMTRELQTLNESLTALAYAALGQRGPDVRRRSA